MSLAQTPINPNDVTINPEYEEMVPPLTDHEYSVLKQSVIENDFFERIKINRNKVILDGHHRYKVWKDTGIIPKFEFKEFDSPYDEACYVIKTNLERRNLNVYQKTVLIEKLEKIEAVEARQRQTQAGELFGKGKDSISSNELNLSEGQARDKAAKAYNVSPTTYHRAKTILHKGSPELKAKVASGETSINYAYNKINRIERHTETRRLHSDLS